MYIPGIPVLRKLRQNTKLKGNLGNVGILYGKIRRRREGDRDQTLGRLRQEKGKFKASLGNYQDPVSKTKIKATGI